MKIVNNKQNEINSFYIRIIIVEIRRRAQFNIYKQYINNEKSTSVMKTWGIHGLFRRAEKRTAELRYESRGTTVNRKKILLYSVII